MKLVLMRHGQAVDRDQFVHANKDDALRPLTEKGKSRSEKMAKFLSRQIETEWIILTSPYLRTVQTAQAVRSQLKVQAIKEVVELVPSAPPQALAERIRGDFSKATALLCVGHEPQLGGFASWLLSGLQQSFFELRKSSLVHLEVESFSHLAPGRAELQFFISPKQLED